MILAFERLELGAAFLDAPKNASEALVILHKPWKGIASLSNGGMTEYGPKLIQGRGMRFVSKGPGR